MSETVLQQLDDGVLRLTLNRPARKNAFDGEQWRAFADALAAADADPRVACIVLTGAGGNFSSGNDLTADQAAGADGEHGFHLSTRRLAALRKPLVGAAQGVAVGGGATILLHCDVLYVGESLRYRFPFASLGLAPEFGCSYLLPLQVGMRRAAELLLTAEWIDAARAVEVGIATRACPDADVLDVALGKAHEIARWPVSSLVEIKRLLRAAHGEALGRVIADENDTLLRMVGSPENMEAIMAFVEKRPADFSRFRS